MTPTAIFACVRRLAPHRTLRHRARCGPAAAAATVATAALALSATPAAAAVLGPTPDITSVAGVPPATRLQLNPDHIGHVQLIPFYTVLGGYDTYLTLTNTDTLNAKALKVRFRSAANGDTVFDFTLLLAPADSWSAAITRDASTGLPRLVHNDRSCTLPADVKTTFGTSRLSPALSQDERVRQASTGSVEVITMADVPPFRGRAERSPLFDALTPFDSFVPPGTKPTCAPDALSVLATEWSNYGDSQLNGLYVPTTGLRAQWVLINVPQALSFAGNGTAVEARTDAGKPGFGNAVVFPQTAQPVAPLALLRRYTTDPLLRGGIAATALGGGAGLDGVAPTLGAASSDLPDLSTPYLPAALNGALEFGRAARQQTHALNRTLAATSIANDYVVDPNVQARTDWVVALPTLRYQAAVRDDPATPGGHALVFTDLTVDDRGATTLPGAFNDFGPTADGRQQLYIVPDTGQLMLGSTMSSPVTTAWSREGPVTMAGNRPVFVPSSPLTFRSGRFYGMTGAYPFWPVVSDSQRLSPPLSVLAQPQVPVVGNLVTDPPGFNGVLPAGWARTTLGGVANQGLPIIGFAAISLFNAAASPGFAGSYGLTLPHAFTRP